MFKEKETIIFELKQKFKQYFPKIDLNVTQSPENAFIQTFAYLWTSLVRYIDYAMSQVFPQNAVGSILDLWVTMTVGTRNVGTTATGSIWCSGNVGGQITSGLELANAQGGSYITTSGATIANFVYTVTNVEQLDSKRLRLTLNNNVVFPSLTTVAITGATPSSYNNTYTASTGSLPANKIDINVGLITTVPTAPFTVTATGATVNVSSEDEGSDFNLSEGESLTFSTTIADVESTCVVQKGGVIGGTDSETDEEVRLRVLQWLRQPITYLNEGHIRQLCLKTKGISRVFIRRATPVAGRAEIYCVKDSVNPKTLTSGDIAEIQSRILEVLDISHTITDYTIGSPTITPVNIVIAGLSSASPSLRASITSNLDGLMNDRETMGGSLDIDLIRNAIGAGVDSDTLTSPASYELTSPSSNLTFGATEIPTLGTVTFS